MNDFDACFARLMLREGGDADHPADPGGRTRYGISQRAYPREDIAALTLDRARHLYWRDYWDPAGCERLPEALRFDFFDAAVNSGIAAATRWLQRAAGVPADGRLGPVTLAALRRADAQALRARMAGARLEALASLPAWPAFGRGWVRRVAQNLLEG